MREIKFRAWDKLNKMMVYPYLRISEGGYISGEAYHYPDPECDWAIMQYTGLKDKNGKEIYEGDLLKVKYVGSLMPVKWLNDSAGFHLAYLENNECEVIGNIYENPELLEGG